MGKTLNGSWAVLRSEFDGCAVSAWLMTELRIKPVPEGTRVKVMSEPDLRGYVLVMIGDQPMEVWYECVRPTSATLN